MDLDPDLDLDLALAARISSSSASLLANQAQKLASLSPDFLVVVLFPPSNGGIGLMEEGFKEDTLDPGRTLTKPAGERLLRGGEGATTGIVTEGGGTAGGG